MNQHVCRACRGADGDIVLDLGMQPACDFFPQRGSPGPDPAYPLQMWLCADCGLAQLMADPTTPEEPRGIEPLALGAQAAEAIRCATAAGLLAPGATVAEYGSPHGGSWLGSLTSRGLEAVPDDESADVIVDCFGMMHCPDQAAALAQRVARLEPGGTLLLQFHSLEAVMRLGQWNVLRHGHYAYYSTTALATMLSWHGLRPLAAWQFDLYGGTVLLAAGRNDADEPDEMVPALLAGEVRAGVTDPAALGRLQGTSRTRATALHSFLATERSRGHTVLGYGAASRAVALLCLARIDSGLLPAIVDRSTDKHGRRMPGTDIPVTSPAELSSRKPHAIVLFLSDLQAEVLEAYPQVTHNGGSWIDVETLECRARIGRHGECASEDI
jgi:hypothetical protein